MTVRTLRTRKECLHQLSPGNGVTVALGDAQPGGNGTNIGFPGGERPSPFQATSSQVPKGWDRNFGCGLSPLPAG